MGYEKILNIWVCNIDTGILGWAQFPAGGNPATDGVVIDYEKFGTTGTVSHPYDLGRTTTHEVGHWLNLWHIWEIILVVMILLMTPQNKKMRIMDVKYILIQVVIIMEICL